MNIEGLPKRIRTGVGNRTITLYRDLYLGHPKHFEFNKAMRGHYEYLSSVLDQAGLEFTLMGAERTVPGTSTWRQAPKNGLLRFIVIAGDPFNPDFVWHKYEGNTPGGGQNRVYVAGKELHTSTFRCMDRFMAVMHCMKTTEGVA